MKISELLKQDKVTLSFEVFPPKTSSSYESVARATQEIAALRPDFMSVTYGAGGGTSEHTVNIAADLRKKYDVTVLTHLTCVSSTREHVAKMVQKYKENGIENILALRGDIPEGGAPHSDYHYAAELVRDIKSQGDFCIGGACYPEGHPESGTYENDIKYLKEKVPNIDLVLFPVDRRMGKDYMKGAKQFIEQIKTTIFVPMHFSEDYEGGNALRSFAENAGCRFISITHRGESFEITK